MDDIETSHHSRILRGRHQRETNRYIVADSNVPSVNCQSCYGHMGRDALHDTDVSLLCRKETEMTHRKVF